MKKLQVKHLERSSKDHSMDVKILNTIVVKTIEWGSKVKTDTRKLTSFSRISHRVSRKD